MPQSGNSGVSPDAAHPVLAVAPHVLQEQIAERDCRDAVAPRALHRRRHRRLVLALLHGEGISTVSSGSPTAAAWRQQLAADGVHRHPIERLVEVVSRPTTSTACCRSTCSVHALSLPEDQARRALVDKGDPYPRTSRTAALPRAQRRTLSTVVSAIARSAGAVKYAWCPVMMTFGNVSRRAKTSSR